MLTGCILSNFLLAGRTCPDVHKEHLVPLPFTAGVFDRVTFYCENGYATDDDSNLFNATCLYDGTWSAIMDCIG